MEKISVFDRINNWIKNSITIKLLSIGFLILILLIPTSMLQSLIRERQQIRDAAISEVSSKWGNRQSIGGPVLTIPYEVESKDSKGNTYTQIHYAHFLPERLNITGDVKPEKRYRGIYVVVLYKTLLHVNGSFNYPDLQELGIDSARCKFDKAFVSIGITDLKGVNENLKININESSLPFQPGIPTHDILESGMNVRFPITDAKEFKFSYDIDLNGSSNISFLPLGKETTVHLSSPWTSPSFEGTFLPENKSISDKGFTADWKVLQVNRNYPQQGIGNFIQHVSSDEDYDPFASFGVKLMLPVDEYLKTMRSVKYCLMFIIITFLTFFFVEILNNRRIHPIQYLLVGAAVCLFYVLLLSISEHLNFGWAYLIGCTGIVALITFYVRHVFKNLRLTIIFSVLLTLLYGFFYSLLQLEDYALLLGSIGLFVILATIMYLTRKVNWYRNEVVAVSTTELESDKR